MKSAAIAGTSVTESSAAKAIEKVLVNASGLKSRPSVPSSVNTGRNATVMTSNEKKIGRPTSMQSGRDHLLARGRAPGGFPVLQPLVHVLDHDDRRVDHRADGDGDPAQHMMLAPRCRAAIGTKASSTAMGNIRTGTSVERTCRRNTG